MKVQRSCCAGMRWRRVCVSIFWIVLVVYLIVLSTSLKKLSSSPHVNDFEKPLEIVILLQPSPVDTSNQIARLSNIDSKSWGQWVEKPSRLSNLVTIYAGIPIDSSKQLRNPILQFKNIKAISLSSVIPESDKGKPGAGGYLFMVEQFLRLLLISQRPFRWFMFANDHTFIVPDNLYCLVNGKDFEMPLYGGSILQRGKHLNVPLKFASGGAGVVMSHTSLKLLVITWILTGNEVLSKFLSEPTYDEFSKKCESDNVRSNERIHLVGLSGNDLYCAMQQVRTWMHHTDEVPPLTIKVSSKVQLLLSRGLDEFSLRVQFQTLTNAERGHIPLVNTLTREMLLQCDATTSWDRLNPGLVVAFCLQHVYNAKILPTTEEAIPVPGHTSAERFNVYGTVRTLSGTVDSWFTECKHNLIPGSLDQDRDKLKALQVPIKVAPDVVSFHYVSQAESTLLYQMLSRQIRFSSSEALMRAWPSSDKEVGHYSRKFKDVAEAENVLAFINQAVVLEHCAAV